MRLELTPDQLKALRKASGLIRACDVEGYFELKGLYGQPGKQARDEFEKKFAAYYGVGRRSVSFRQQYFRLFFADSFQGQDPYTAPLQALHAFNQMLECSFVSKMVAFHDESWPIDDRNVRQFFGLTVSSNASHDLDSRIRVFVCQMNDLKECYRSLATEPSFIPVIQSVRTRFGDAIPGIKRCHDARIVDFMVWTAVDRKLTSRLG